MPPFQSTRPVWSATQGALVGDAVSDVSIHAPRVERDRTAGDGKTPLGVSIHAPRVERDGEVPG